MSEIINMVPDGDNVYKQDSDEERSNVASVQNAMALNETMKTVNGQLAYEVKQYNSYASSMENINQRYLNAEAGRQWIYNNELQKYNILMDRQNNLLNNRINFPEISLWRYKKLLYYRTNSGELIIDDPIEIQKELSSRYGPDVYIVYDLNDVLKNNTQLRVNTVFIAINCVLVVDQEIVEPNSKYELLQYADGTCRRNLLSHTRYMKKRLLKHNTSDTFTKKVMSCITERNSDCISPWIKDIATENDTILLLVGNQALSEDLVVDKVIKQLFNQGIVVTLTDEILQEQSFEEILSGVFCLHINKIPYDEKEREKLKDLLVSTVIHKSVLSNGYTIPIQVKVVVTIDEVDPFFKDMMELTKTLFINTKESLLQQLNFDSLVPLYKGVEKSLDHYSYEVSSLRDNPLDQYKNDNEKYLELLEENETEEINSENFQVIDPYEDSFKRYFPIGQYHTYITGLTRIGKSSFLIILFMYYIQNRKAVTILFDVHGDLAKKAKMLVKDKERLLYISNSLDKSYVASINLFILDDESEKSISKRANVILGVLKQIKADESFSGPMEEALLRCIRVLLRKGNGSFEELYRFMNDKRNHDLVQYAKGCGNTLDEEYFSDYFNDTNTKNAIRRRLGTLLSDEDFINMMSGNGKCIDFEKEFNTAGKIIIIDIAKGDMDSYVYYIRFIVEYILVLALNRVKTPEEDRVMTHLILDEFDNFISSNNNIKTIFKEAGKYNLLLTLAQQVISDIKDPSLRDVVLSLTEKKVIFKNYNNTLGALNKTLNKDLDVENFNKGECYITVENNGLVKAKSTTRFLDDSEEISAEKWKEYEQYQLTENYRPLKPETTSQPTADELIEMIQKFKDDFKSKNLLESSCLYRLKSTAPKMFDEIEQNFEYETIKERKYTPRVLKRGINEVFKLAFGLDHLIDIDEFAKKLTSTDENNMFNQTSSGTRQKEFTDDGTSKTEQYYYFQS
jgi:hypothetical protein